MGGRVYLLFFFLNDTATTEIYTLPLHDALPISDSESEDAPGKDTNNPGCKRGIRGGSVKDGKVQFYIPPPPVPDPKFPPPEGVAVDSHGAIYAAAVQAKEVYKYVKK